MNERINRLRTQSLAAVPSLSDERARLLTGFFKSGVARTSPIPVQRAMAFCHHYAKQKDIYRARRTDRGRTRTGAQSHAHLPGSVHPLPGGSGHYQRA
jgi:hypothetical protein